MVASRISVLRGQALLGSDPLVFFEKFLVCWWMDVNTVWIFHILTVGMLKLHWVVTPLDGTACSGGAVSHSCCVKLNVSNF